MPVEVLFRGPMLFLSNAGTIKGVLVPDADKEMNTYPDGEPGARHFARMFVHAKSQRGPTISFRGMDITIDDGSRADCARDVSMDTIVSMDQLLPGVPPVDRNDSLISSAITVVGGTMRAEKNSENVYTFPKTFNPAAAAPPVVRLVCRWSTPADSVRLTLTPREKGKGEVTILTLTGNDRAYVYNFDQEHISEHVFMQGQEACVGTGQKEDVDFKWNFHMLRKPEQGWKSRSPLPTPMYACDSKVGENMLSPDSGDCLSAIKEI